MPRFPSRQRARYASASAPGDGRRSDGRPYPGDVKLASTGDPSYVGEGALPTLVVIGAMKAATTALHGYLDAHPQIAMSRPKELNFFNGPAHSLPDSQYLSRSRYFERLTPFLDHFHRDELHVVVQERLLNHPQREMRRILEQVRVSPGTADQVTLNRGAPRTPSPRIPAALRSRVDHRVGDDVERLCDLLDEPLDEWSPT